MEARGCSNRHWRWGGQVKLPVAVATKGMRELWGSHCLIGLIGWSVSQWRQGELTWVVVSCGGGLVGEVSHSLSSSLSSLVSWSLSALYFFFYYYYYFSKSG